MTCKTNVQPGNGNSEAKIITQLLTHQNSLPASLTRAAADLSIVAAQLNDCDSVVDQFGALRTYNAWLDAHFTLADGWETLLRQEFRNTVQHPDH